MSVTAPYTNAMRIGQGFNTYTQEIRLDNAVAILKKSPASPTPTPQPSDSQNEAVPTTEEIATAPIPPSSHPEDHSRPSLPQDQSTWKVEPSTALAASRPSIGKAQPQVSLSRETAFSTRTRGPIPSAMSLFNNNATHPQPPGEDMIPFIMPSGPPTYTDQSVTYSTQAIENVSDIMDALNISTAMSIKFGTIHGNGSASFVNETKVLDSQLNYIVSVTVNNDSQADLEDMAFQPLDGLPPDRFTEVYGDTFISGFLEGGEFNAVISIQVNDTSRLKEVKQAIDLQLAVGPPPSLVDVSAREAFNKSHAAILQDTEITISVNWVGGGDIKKPEVPWTLASVVAVANAFPSMVARSSARISAILTRYESLRSFQAWKWAMMAKDGEWARAFVILNYVPCAVYTADLFEALMKYKKLWKRIGEILQNPSMYKARELPAASKQLAITARNDEATRLISRPQPNPNNVTDLSSPCETRNTTSNIPRVRTFAVTDVSTEEGWDLFSLNHDLTPIPVEPLALNEARLLCRQAMTLITEEAARLVDHPHLAYAEYNANTGKTLMKRPNYVYPEVLRNRLPIRRPNAASDRSWTQDAAAVLTHAYSRDDDLFCHLIGDTPHPDRTYKSFTSLALTEGSQTNPQGSRENTLLRISIHGYHHHWIARDNFDKGSDDAIGAIGFGFSNDHINQSDGDSANGTSSTQLLADQCSAHFGHPTFHAREAGPPFKAVDLTPPSALHRGGLDGRDISRVDVCYVPGSGRVSGLVLYSSAAVHGSGSGRASSSAMAETVTLPAYIERLAWRQWGAAGREPRGLKVVQQRPPEDGARWRFVGLCGEFDASMWGEVLARVSGIWRRV